MTQDYSEFTSGQLIRILKAPRTIAEEWISADADELPYNKTVAAELIARRVLGSVIPQGEPPKWPMPEVMTRGVWVTACDRKERDKWLVTVKDDGSRVLLLAIGALMFTVDNKGAVGSWGGVENVELPSQDSLPQAVPIALFDCEEHQPCDQRPTPLLRVCDLLMVDGRDVRDSPFWERLEMARGAHKALADQLALWGEAELISRVQLKRFFKGSKLKTKLIPQVFGLQTFPAPHSSLAHRQDAPSIEQMSITTECGSYVPVDGIIFAEADHKWVRGRTSKIRKLKQNITLDLTVMQHELGDEESKGGVVILGASVPFWAGASHSPLEVCAMGYANANSKQIAELKSIFQQAGSPACGGCTERGFATEPAHPMGAPHEMQVVQNAPPVFVECKYSRRRGEWVVRKLIVMDANQSVYIPMLSTIEQVVAGLLEMRRKSSPHLIFFFRAVGLDAAGTRVTIAYGVPRTSTFLAPGQIRLSGHPSACGRDKGGWQGMAASVKPTSPPFSPVNIHPILGCRLNAASIAALKKDMHEHERVCSAQGHTHDFIGEFHLGPPQQCSATQLPDVSYVGPRANKRFPNFHSTVIQSLAGRASLVPIEDFEPKKKKLKVKHA